MIEKSQAKKGVEAVLGLVKLKDDPMNIVDQPNKIDLQVTMKNVPKVKHQAIQLSLPHSLHYEMREVCIFVKDLDQKNREYELTVQHFEDLFREKNVTVISKIVPIKALRTDYSMSSNKRSLAKAYDLYLADSRVFGALPGLLGKIFFDKKKSVPVQVNLSAKDLKQEIENVVNNSRFVLQGTGSSSMVCVAHDNMSVEEITDNVLAAANQLSEKIPGGVANIRNIHIKSTDTTAIPLYVSLGAPNEIKLPHVKREKLETFIDDVTTVENGQVMVQADGRVSVVRPGQKRTRDDTKKVKKNAKKPKLEIKDEIVDISEEVTEKKVKSKKKPPIKSKTNVNGNKATGKNIKSSEKLAIDGEMSVDEKKSTGKKTKGSKKQAVEGKDSNVKEMKKGGKKSTLLQNKPQTAIKKMTKVKKPK